VGVLRFCLPWRALDFRERIDPAQVLTFFCFLLRFLVRGLVISRTSAGLTSGHWATCSEERLDDDAAASFCDSEDPALWGRKRVGEATKGSKLKKDHFLLDFVGLGVASSILADGGGRFPRQGMDPRRRGGTEESTPSWLLCVRSRTAPAVLGRDSFSLRLALNPRGELRSRSGLESEITDEMLPERECPGRAVTVLEVSLETSDRGLGMNSRVSEKPTLLRAVGLGAASASTIGISSSELISTGSSTVGELAFGSDGAAVGAGNSFFSCRSSRAGLAGALLPRML